MAADGADQCGALLVMLQDDFEDAAADALTVGGPPPPDSPARVSVSSLRLFLRESVQRPCRAAKRGRCRSRQPASCRKAKCAAAAALGLVCASGAASVDVPGVAEEVARLLHEEGETRVDTPQPPKAF